MYKPKWFAIHELVPPDVYNARGEKAFELMDDRLLITLDRLRERYGSIIINNYLWGGPREWSGLRTPDSPFYHTFSQHNSGRAADCIMRDTDVNTVRSDILNAPDDFKYINGLELETSWLHIDVRNTQRIKTFTPV